MEKQTSLDFVRDLLNVCEKYGVVWNEGTREGLLQQINKAAELRYAKNESKASWLVDLTEAFLPFLGPMRDCIDCHGHAKHYDEILPAILDKFSLFGIDLPEDVLESLRECRRCFGPWQYIQDYFLQILGIENEGGYIFDRPSTTTPGGKKYDEKDPTLIIKARMKPGASTRNLHIYEMLVRERGLPVQIRRIDPSTPSPSGS